MAQFELTVYMKKEIEMKRKSKVGRKPLADPVIHRYDFRLNAVDSARLENMFDLSGYKNRSHFIRDKVLKSKPRILTTDKVLGDYLILLSQMRGQFRGIGNNYNQVLRLLMEHLGRDRTLKAIYKLEKATIELIQGSREIEKQITKLEALWLQK